MHNTLLNSEDKRKGEEGATDSYKYIGELYILVIAMLLRTTSFIRVITQQIGIITSCIMKLNGERGDRDAFAFSSLYVWDKKIFFCRLICHSV